jgi:hypothetical protein
MAVILRVGDIIANFRHFFNLDFTAILLCPSFMMPLPMIAGIGSFEERLPGPRGAVRPAGDGSSSGMMALVFSPPGRKMHHACGRGFKSPNKILTIRS